MAQYCPDLCHLFATLSNGSIPSHKAKESLEMLLGDRLWTNQTAFWKFREHSYKDVDVAYKLYQIRPPSSLLQLTNRQTKRFQFSPHQLRSQMSAKKDCNAHGMGNFGEDILNYFSLPIRSNYNDQLCQ